MRHRGFGILVARSEPPFERLAVRRQDEHAHHIARQALLELPRALPVDVEQHVVARLQGLQHRRSGRGVELPEHFRPFEQLAARSSGARTHACRRRCSRRRRPRRAGVCGSSRKPTCECLRRHPAGVVRAWSCRLPRARRERAAAPAARCAQTPLASPTQCSAPARAFGR